MNTRTWLNSPFRALGLTLSTPGLGLVAFSPLIKAGTEPPGVHHSDTLTLADVLLTLVTVEPGVELGVHQAVAQHQ